MDAVLGALANLPWARFLPPLSTRELLIDQFFGAVGYLLIALILGFVRRKRKAFDMASVVRAMIAGASLPPALMLATVPLFPDELKLFGETTMQAYIMIAGLILTVLSIYGLMK